MLSTIVIIVILFLLWQVRQRIGKSATKVLDIADDVLEKTSKVLDVGDTYIEGWKQDAEDQNALNRARRQKQLQEELESLNQELASKGIKPVELPNGKQLLKTTKTTK